MRYLLLFLLLFLTRATFSQNNFNIGGCYGFGLTVPSSNTIITTSFGKLPMKGSLQQHLGAIAQYIINTKFGIEVGIIPSSQTYVEKLNDTFLRNINLYTPIKLVYRIHSNRNPLIHYNFLAGASLHWTNTFYGTHNSGGNGEEVYVGMDPGYTIMVPCIDAEVRIGKQLIRGGRLEFGLGYQISIKGRYQAAIRSQTSSSISSTINQLTLTMYCFVFK